MKKTATVLVCSLFGLLLFALWVLTTPNNFVLRMFRQPVEEINLNAGLVTGPYPEEEDFVKLKEAGVQTIVSLLHRELPHEEELLAQEQALAGKYGIELVNLPMKGPNDKEFESAGKNAADFILASTKKTYLHCYTGSHRMNLVRSLVTQAGRAAETYEHRPDRRTEQGKILDRAKEQYASGNIPEVIAIIEAAPKPLDAPLLVLLGWAYYRESNIDLARRNFEEARGREVEALTGLGYCTLRDSKPDEALVLFTESLAQKPEQPGAWIGSGIAHYHAKRLDEAEQCLRKALEMSPQNGDALMFLDKVLAAKNAAAKPPEPQPEPKPEPKPDPVAVAGQKFGEKNYQECIQILTQEQTLATSGRILLGWAYYRTKDYEKAAAQFDMEKDNSVEALGGLGYCKLQLKDLEAAAALFGRALQQTPADQSALMGMGLVMYRSSKFAEAASYFETVLTQNPNNTEAQELLNKIHSFQKPEEKKE